MVNEVKICAFALMIVMMAVLCTIGFTSCHPDSEDRYQNPVLNNNSCMMNGCQTTKDYRPFCGSDGYTYNTPSILHCFKRCGIDITANHTGKCEDKKLND